MLQYSDSSLTGDNQTPPRRFFTKIGLRINSSGPTGATEGDDGDSLLVVEVDDLPS
jgi:hypothetical protein